MAGKNPFDPNSLPPATDESEATLMGAQSPFAPAPAPAPAPSNRPVPTYGRPIQFRPAAVPAEPEPTDANRSPDSTMRAQPAFNEEVAHSTMEESQSTVMQQSPFVTPSLLPDVGMSVEPTAVKGNAKRGTTGARAALKLPEPDAPPIEESNSTLIFDSKRHVPPAAAPPPADENATFMMTGAAAQAQVAANVATGSDSTDSSDDMAGEPTQDPTAKRDLPKKGYSRPAAPEVPESTVNVAKKKEAAESQVRGPQAVILLLMATVAIALGASLLKGDPKPSLNDLRAAYPYGSTGARLPNGRTAPGEYDVEYIFEKTAECHGQICYQYQARAIHGGFDTEMLLYKDSGIWANDASAGMRAP